MKKFYAIVAAALMSVSLFAAPTQIPTEADLAAKYDVAGKVVLCCFFDVTPCNPIVLAGTYNSWSSEVNKCLELEELDGFAGWYVVEIDWTSDLGIRPLQLNNGGFDGWAYCAAGPDAWVLKGATAATVSGSGFGDEGTASFPGPGAYIYEITRWKNDNNPCGEHISHTYHIYFLPPYCEENEDDFVPAIAGDFNSWAVKEMDETFYKGQDAYGIVITSEEGKEFKFMETNFGWKNEFQYLKEEDQSWNNFDNSKFPKAEGKDNDVDLVVDYSAAGKFRYTLCGVEIVDVAFSVKMPEGAPAAGVELMGSFYGGLDFGKGVKMEVKDGLYTANVRAVEVSEFKFREAGDLDWKNQIEIFDESEETWKDANNWQFGEEWAEEELGKMLIELDLSDASIYRWKVAQEQGIQKVTLTEKAHKVVVDGVLYIVRDNKMFNVQGTQVR